MASYGWGTEHSVERWLFAEGHRFDFYQAVRLLELMYPNRHPVGESSDPAHEVVRFKSFVSMAFPGSEIRTIEAGANGDPAEMTVNFMGLAGALGPMPFPYTELVLERASAKDTAMREFLNMFNHRLVSLMHRVRKVHRIGYDLKAPDETPVARYLYSLLGLGTGNLQGRMGLRDRSLLHYAGLMSHHPRSVAGLEAMIGDFFDIPVKAVQMCGRWLTLDDDQTTAIGLSGRNQELGSGALLGRRIWDQTGKFELHIGPMSFERFQEFLPDGPAHRPLCALTSFYAGTELESAFVLTVHPYGIPGAKLSQDDGSRLGWTSWLKTARPLEGTFSKKLSPAFQTS